MRWLGQVDYLSAWELQREIHAQVVTGELPDTLILLEHEGVFTAGKRTEPGDRPLPGSNARVIDVDRGGKITWHGPGQLTGYPILRLPPMGGESAREGMVDVVAYVRRVEQLLIDVCADLGVEGVRVEGRSGVWVQRTGRPDAKVAAIGIRVARGVAMHGFAINADCDLSAYDAIVPCGIRDVTVTSLTELLGRDVTVDEVRELIVARADTLTAPTRELQGTMKS